MSLAAVPGKCSAGYKDWEMGGEYWLAKAVWMGEEAESIYFNLPSSVASNHVPGVAVRTLAERCRETVRRRAQSKPIKSQRSTKSEAEVEDGDDA